MIRINDRFSIDSYPQGWQVTETITLSEALEALKADAR